jgi:hypothetical protein
MYDRFSGRRKSAVRSTSVNSQRATNARPESSDTKVLLTPGDKIASFAPPRVAPPADSVPTATPACADSVDGGRGTSALAAGGDSARAGRTGRSIGSM